MDLVGLARCPVIKLSDVRTGDIVVYSETGPQGSFMVSQQIRIETVTPAGITASAVNDIRFDYLFDLDNPKKTRNFYLVNRPVTLPEGYDADAVREIFRERGYEDVEAQVEKLARKVQSGSRLVRSFHVEVTADHIGLARHVMEEYFKNDLQLGFPYGITYRSG